MERHATVQKLAKATGRPYYLARVLAHNAEFDCRFTTAWFKRNKQFLSAGTFEPLCTLNLARWLTQLSPKPPENHKLGTLCEWFGVDLTGAHDALSDVRATVKLAQCLRDLLRAPHHDAVDEDPNGDEEI